MTKSTIAPVRYITEEDGRRVGVVLDWEDYKRLRELHVEDTDLLPGLTRSELEALAHSKLSIDQQTRLDELLNEAKKRSLTHEEERELNQILEYIDQLNLLKARAMLTLQIRFDESASSVET
ncbi:MAG TPA: hypothetical protein ENK60_01280 [Anaerolineae bacterium]|nr:hypothetical protein [Anaerolineae bacterium]